MGAKTIKGGLGIIYNTNQNWNYTHFNCFSRTLCMRIIKKPSELRLNNLIFSVQMGMHRGLKGGLRIIYITQTKTGI